MNRIARSLVVLLALALTLTACRVARMGAGIGVPEAVRAPIHDVETADVVLMKSNPADVVMAIEISKATLRKMKQNLGWAAGYNLTAIPVAAGALAWAGITLRPEIGALAMSGSSIIVAFNATLLKRANLTEIGD